MRHTDFEKKIQCDRFRTGTEYLDTNNSESASLFRYSEQNKIQVSRRPSCHKTTKGSLQNVGWKCFRRTRKP